jgi:hypothetical protein
MRTAGKAGETPSAVSAPFLKMKPDGKPERVNQVRTVIDTGDPNTLFRNYLEAQYSQNAFFVLAGPATNLAAALEFRGMKELIADKIKYLVVSGGAFPSGAAEANIRADVAAAKKVFAEWPTPIIAAGSEVGTAFEFPGASIDKEFAANSPGHPVAEAYRAWKAMPYNAPASALAAALHAGRPKEGYFNLSESGTITVHDDGRTSFAAGAGKHQFLIADPSKKEKVVQAYVDLTSAKPVFPQRFRPPAAVNLKKPAEEPDKPAVPPQP